MESQTFNQKEDSAPTEITIRDRINFVWLLTNQIYTFQKALLNREYSDVEIKASIQGLINLVPDSWKDKQYHKDIENSVNKVKVDIRRTNGTTPLSDAWHKQRELPLTKKVDEPNYFLMLQAVMNLLNRRHMLTRINKTEQSTGTPYKPPKNVKPTPVFENPYPRKKKRGPKPRKDKNESNK